ncbi:Ankyrin repeat [Macleaya cordata]|uniref:Ankyrin repeat n=1 Tax=Macleaya cordata TaxID=56857 RepID=A0A200PSP9_MACCD|nr:Ankyrin repeat [Macleaya cordata]
MNIEQAAREDHWENIVSLMESSVVAFEKMVHHICTLSLEDPLVNVLIAFKKTSLAVDVVGVIEDTKVLEKENFKGDTALHVAASMENITVARALLDRNPKLIFKTNSFNETPLHKAALNGHSDIFWELVVRGSDVLARRKDGTTILHCAVIENQFGILLATHKKSTLLIGFPSFLQT